MTTTQEKLAELDAQIAELTETRKAVVAFDAGEKIQGAHVSGDEWGPCHNPAWHPDFKYRVAPEPLTGWFVYNAAKERFVEGQWSSEENARAWIDSEYRAPNQKYRVVKMVEKV